MKLQQSSLDIVDNQPIRGIIAAIFLFADHLALVAAVHRENAYQCQQGQGLKHGDW